MPTFDPATGTINLEAELPKLRAIVEGVRDEVHAAYAKVMARCYSPAAVRRIRAEVTADLDALDAAALHTLFEEIPANA
jgi:hypothetical protein